MEVGGKHFRKYPFSEDFLKIIPGINLRALLRQALYHLS
jgi:hypothetical protein